MALGFSSPDFRFIASHYPHDDLNITVPLILKKMQGCPKANQELKRWLSGGRRNYWLSAHTHRENMEDPPQRRIKIGGIFGMFCEGSFGSVNIGSTTDYRAHVAVVEQCASKKAEEKNYVKNVDKYVRFREIPLFDCDECYLQDVLYKIACYGFEHGKGRQGVSLLGLNKDYQKDYWTEGHTEESVDHLVKFIEQFMDPYDNCPEKEGDKIRKKLVACLGFIAGAYEEGKITKDCDFSKKFLKKLCKGK